MTLGDTLRHLGLHAGDDQRTDAELLTRFVQIRDEPAFAELLRRHGPTVYGVCRRIVGHSHDADDAFQAVFLVLARKAESVRPPGMVGNWLYGVAVRTANKARVMNAKRQARELANRRREPADGSTGTQSVSDGVLKQIDAELASLPAVYRAVFVACDLNGRSRSEAAKELGWPEGTVAARLAKARELLAARLTKRGVTLGVGVFTTAAVPPVLATDTLSAVRELVAVGTATAVAPAAQQLSTEVVKSMTGIKLKLAAVGVLVAALTAGTVLMAGPGEKPGQRPERKQVTNAPVPKPNTEWNEAKSITFDDGGRVTSVAYSPSGEIIAVCRDTGAINFLKAKTRERLTEMAVKHDLKANPNTEVGTVTALAFRPTPHPKHGEVFAVTHKNGYKVGAIGVGIPADTGVHAEGIDPSFTSEGFDPTQIAWVSDDTRAWSNGSKIEFSEWRKEDKQGVGGAWTVPSVEHGQAVVLAPVPGQKAFLCSNWDIQKTTNGLHIRSEDVTIPRQLPGGLANPTFKVTHQLFGHKSRPTHGAVAKDGKRIITGDEGGTLIVWEGEKFEEQRRIEQGPGLAALALAPDGKTVAVLRSHGVDWLGAAANRSSTVFQLYVFDVTNPPAKPTPIWTSDTRAMPGKRSGPASLTFSPDGKTLLAAFADPYIADKDAKSVGVKVWELVPKK